MNEEIFSNMFGSSAPPEINFDLSDIPLIARKVMIGKVSITGAQPKLTVKLNNKVNQLEVVSEDSEFILKPQSNVPQMPEIEQCCMDIAQNLGMDVPLHCLLPLRDGSRAFVIKRFDRENGKKIHLEDFAQLLGLKDKYAASAEQMIDRLKEISAKPHEDAASLFNWMVLNLILGNADTHLKNYSVTYKTGSIRLSPVYDILCTKLLSNDNKDSATPINGRLYGISRRDIDALADHAGIQNESRYHTFENKFNIINAVIVSSCLHKKTKLVLTKLIEDNFFKLGIKS